jgi:putative Mn2+ efflux pump MntP
MTDPLKALKECIPLVMTGLLMVIAFFMADKNETLNANTHAVNQLTVTVALNTSTAKLNTGSLSDLEVRVRTLEELALTD